MKNHEHKDSSRVVSGASFAAAGRHQPFFGLSLLLLLIFSVYASTISTRVIEFPLKDLEQKIDQPG